MNSFVLAVNLCDVHPQQLFNLCHLLSAGVTVECPCFRYEFTYNLYRVRNISGKLHGCSTESQTFCSLTAVHDKKSLDTKHDFVLHTATSCMTAGDKILCFIIMCDSCRALEGCGSCLWRCLLSKTII